MATRSKPCIKKFVLFSWQRYERGIILQARQLALLFVEIFCNTLQADFGALQFFVRCFQVFLGVLDLVRNSLQRQIALTHILYLAIDR